LPAGGFDGNGPGGDRGGAGTGGGCFPGSRKKGGIFQIQGFPQKGGGETQNVGGGGVGAGGRGRKGGGGLWDPPGPGGKASGTKKKIGNKGTGGRAFPFPRGGKGGQLKTSPLARGAFCRGGWFSIPAGGGGGGNFFKTNGLSVSFGGAKGKKTEFPKPGIGGVRPGSPPGGRFFFLFGGGFFYKGFFRGFNSVNPLEIPKKKKPRGGFSRERPPFSHRLPY